MGAEQGRPPAGTDERGGACDASLGWGQESRGESEYLVSRIRDLISTETPPSWATLVRSGRTSYHKSAARPWPSGREEPDLCAGTLAGC